MGQSGGSAVYALETYIFVSAKFHQRFQNDNRAARESW